MRLTAVGTISFPGPASHIEIAVGAGLDLEKVSFFGGGGGGGRWGGGGGRSAGKLEGREEREDDFM